MTEHLTLWDYATDPNDLVAGVAKVLREDSKFMDAMTFEPIASLGVKVTREGTMPNVSWRRAGANHGSVKAGKPTEIQEQAYSIGNEVDVDKVYMMDKSPRLYNPMTYQTDMVVRGIARAFTNVVINGLPTDEDNPVGLYWRIMNDLGADQRLSAGGSGLDISGDATSLAQNIQTFIDLLDQLLISVNGSLEAGGSGVLLLANDTLISRLNSAFRQSGLLATTQDALGRKWLEYKGARIIDMGRKYDDTTRIIGNVELTNGTALTGGTATSLYAVKLGKEYFTAWQMYGLDVSEPTLDPVHKVTYTSVIDWVIGLALSNPRSAARLYGLIAA